MILTEEYIKSLDKEVYHNVDVCLDHFANLNLEIDSNFWNDYPDEDIITEMGDNYYMVDNDARNKFCYHVYWYGEFTEKQLLCVKSYIATQNLSRTKLIVWYEKKTIISYDIVEKFTSNHNHYNVYFYEYDPDKMAKGTPFEGCDFINVTEPKKIKYRSDFARMLILYKYGGLYFDLDMILFKDLAPFLHMEFCYQWSNIDGRGNNALLSLHKGSPMCLKIMNKYVNKVGNKNDPTPLNLDLNRVIFDNDLGLVQLPCALFDPCWILQDTNQKSKYSALSNFDDFFKRTDEDINMFFCNKIYVYHWHSRLKYNIEENSYMNRIEIKYNNINNIFDKIFVINLDHRKDRWNECITLFEKYGIKNYERFSAISPNLKEIPYKQYQYFIVNKKDWYVPGAVGCKLSHLNIIKLAKNRGYKNFLVLEDDFCIDKISNEFNTIIYKSMMELGSEWDMLYLGGNNLQKPVKINNNKYIHKAVKTNTTHAYAMNSSIYDKCINEINECGTEIDEYYKNNVQNKCKCYCIFPSLIKQRESVSDIFKGSVMKYNFE